MCLKQQYLTYKLAKDAANAVRKREKQAFRPYKCADCGLFHLTTINKGTKPAKKNKYRFDVKGFVYSPPEKFPTPTINYGYKPVKISLSKAKIIDLSK